jgi:GTP-binding protein EngB required for normal cell division
MQHHMRTPQRTTQIMDMSVASRELSTPKTSRTISTLQASPHALITNTPERTFRVVLAGDASVGKSSLIMRLVKGSYVESLPSTLGIGIVF